MESNHKERKRSINNDDGVHENRKGSNKMSRSKKRRRARQTATPKKRKRSRKNIATMKVNTFRILCLIQGACQEKLEGIATQLTSMGLVSLDPAKLTGPCIFFSQGERFVQNGSVDDQWAVALMYIGKGSKTDIRQAGMRIEFEGELIYSSTEGIRVKGCGPPEFTNPIQAFLADPSFGEPEYHAADPTIRFCPACTVDQCNAADALGWF
jgi:hypothetical protein